MLELLNVRISFFNRKTHPNEHGNFPIILRITYRNERRDAFTGLYCDTDQWSAKNARLIATKANGPVNANLDLIERKAFEAFEGFKYVGDPFTIDELMDRVKGKEEKPVLLMDYLEDQKNKLKKRLHVDITAAKYDKYQRSASHMQEFLTKEFKVRNYSLIRIDKTFLEQYFQYLRSVRKISHNSAVKYITFLKTILMPAIQGGVFKNDPFRELKLRQKPVHKGYLTQEEIDMLTATKMNSKDLDRIRDIFLFCCYTGLAYSDLRQLDKWLVHRSALRKTSNLIFSASKSFLSVLVISLL